MFEVTIKKDETMKVTVEGLEDYPQEFSYQEWLEFTAQCIIRQSQEKRKQEEYAKYQAGQANINNAAFNAGLAQAEMAMPTVHLRPRLGGGY